MLGWSLEMSPFLTLPHSLRRFACAGVSSLILAGAAQAATISVTQSLDLNDFIASFAGGQYSLYFGAAAPVTIDEGDDVEVTYLFLNSQALKLTNTSAVSSLSYDIAWPWLGDQGPNYDNFRILNSTVTLLNPVFSGSGAGTTTFFSASEESGVAHLGPFPMFGLDSATSVLFTGLHATYHVDQLHLPDPSRSNPSSQDYDPNYVPGSGPNNYVPWFHSFTTGWEVADLNSNSVSDTAGSFTLILLGIAGLVAHRRLRR